MRLVNEKAERERQRLIERARMRAIDREILLVRWRAFLVALPWAALVASIGMLLVIASKR